MKLRQKLAVVLASAMVVTAVPVVTMASTTNKIVKSVSVIKKDDKTTGVSLKMKFEQEPEKVEEFYLDLTNAKWLKGDKDEDDGKDFALLSGVFTTVDGNSWSFKTTGNKSGDEITVTYKRQGDTTVRVNVAGAGEEDTIELPLPIKATGGAASVAVTGQGSSAIVTEGNYSFLSTGEKAASLTVADPKAFYDNGELAAITLKETFINSFAASGKDMIVKIKLEDTDFEFEPTSTVTIKGSYGFDFAKTSDSSKVKFAVDADDKSTAYVWISKSVAADAKSLGRIEIAGIEVDSDEKDLTLGDLTADITTVTSVAAKDTVNGIEGLGGKDSDGKETAGAELDKDYSDVVLAKIANYGAYIQMKDEKAVDIVAGRDEEVVFEVKESVDDVFVGSRTITLGLNDNEAKTDKQFFMVSLEQTKDPMKIIDDDSRKIVEKVEFVYKDEDDLKAKTGVYLEKEMYRVKEIKVTLKGEDKDGKKLNDNKELDKFKVKTKIYVPVDQQEKKNVEITAEVRGVDEFKSATAVNVVDPFDVTFEQTTFKVGLQNQAAGNITLTEKDKEMLMKGKVTFNVVKGSKITDGIVIEEKGKLTVTGDLKRTDFDADGSQANKVSLKRQSKAASSLAIDDMEVTVDRTVPEGYYDLELSGDAIDEYDGKYKVEKYIVIGTPNTQDITSGGLTKGTATFVIGESKYVLNGVETTMDAPSYIQDPGYTMVPVRYVAQAFGVAEKDIVFGKGTVTLFAGERTISLTNGSNQAIVNGNPVAMGTSVIIKDGRTYAPAGEIARLLGIATAWDSATKTATFTN